MNYSRIYENLIFSAKNRKKPNCYCEKHHIVPKSMGGDDSKENLAILTAREHFLAHWLLKKIHNNKQMIYAFHSMTKPVGNNRQRYTSHSFKYAREAMAKWMKENNSGKNNALFGKTGEKSPNFGSKRTDKTKLNISAAAKKRYLNNEHPNSLMIICFETGQSFKSISEAKKTFTKGNINYALKTGGGAGGYHFFYEGSNLDKKENKYSSGENHWSSRKITDELGNIFNTSEEAGKSVNCTGSAISIAIKEDRKCKGRMFSYV
jgi:hypothetical protein